MLTVTYYSITLPGKSNYVFITVQLTYLAAIKSCEQELLKLGRDIDWKWLDFCNCSEEEVVAHGKILFPHPNYIEHFILLDIWKRRFGAGENIISV